MTAQNLKAIDRSKYLWRVLYFNSADPRLWVKDGVCHWSINFAHPKACNAIGLMILSLGGVSIIVIFSRTQSINYILENKTLLTWYFLSSLSAILIFYLNGLGIRLSKSYAKFIWLGVFSFLLGVGIQGLMNGLPALMIGINRIQWYHHFYFGPVAALCQTFGKYLMIMTAFKIVLDNRKGLELGLLIGLGFTLAEILFLALNAVLTKEPVQGYWIGVWERLSASMFHIYSSGLIAFFILTKQKIFAVIAFVMHALTDTMGGIYLSLHRIPYKIIEVEILFTVFAVLTWCLFLQNKRRVLNYAKTY